MPDAHTRFCQSRGDGSWDGHKRGLGLGGVLLDRRRGPLGLGHGLCLLITVGVLLEILVGIGIGKDIGPGDSMSGQLGGEKECEELLHLKFRPSKRQ